MSPIRTAICYVASVVTGLASSVGVLLLTGIMSGRVVETLRREAWDTDLYWLIGLPLCYLVAGVLGWLGPDRIWRWPLVIWRPRPWSCCCSRGAASRSCRSA